jgi:hypothetical protein
MKNLRKNLRFTVILLDSKRIERIARSAPGLLINERGIESALAQESARVEQFFPGREFRLVPLSNGSFNFVEISKVEAELREKRGELQEKYNAAVAG